MSVPPHVIAASLAALGLHDPAVPVAALVGDSLVDDDVTAPEGIDRLLVFRDDVVTVELEVTYVGDRRRLAIGVTPRHAGTTLLLQPGNDVRREIPDPAADPLDVLPGLTSIVLQHLPDGSTHRTSWLVL